ncbi:MAG: VWA domain-containing protein [Acidobacteria bacterium]|nr:VWA domain-containing protein [Acidobacteriota bacterium]
MFRSGADLVVLPVTVTDARQKYVTGLAMADFHVYEDGVLQEIAFFAADPVPLDLAILLDTSASMGHQLAMAREAAVGFVRTLRAGDRAAVVEFNDAAHLRQPLIEDLERVESAIRETRAGGGTALHTALYIALKELARENAKTGEVRRQAIVLLSDGEDTHGLVTADEVLELVRRSGIAIYTISLRSVPATARGSSGTRVHANTSRSWFASQSDYLMRTLAEETGGRAFFPLAIEELAPLYRVIAEELARQYTLGYNPKNPGLDGAFRRVAVRLPSQPGARPRTRLGYLAPRAVRHASAPR